MDTQTKNHFRKMTQVESFYTRNEKITPNKIIGFLRLHCPEILAYELFKVNDQTLKLESINKFNFNKI